MSFISVILFLLIATIISIIAIVAFGREKFWARIGGEDLGPFDLTNPKRSNRPNDALLSSTGALKNGVKIDATLTAYTSNPEALMHIIDMAMTANGTRFKRVDNGEDETQRRYITWTKTARFPDTNQFQAVKLDDGTTGLIAYACAHVGYSDRGNNLKRLKSITSELRD